MGAIEHEPGHFCFWTRLTRRSKKSAGFGWGETSAGLVVALARRVPGARISSITTAEQQPHDPVHQHPPQLLATGQVRAASTELFDVEHM